MPRKSKSDPARNLPKTGNTGRGPNTAKTAKGAPANKTQSGQPGAPPPSKTHK